MTAATDFETIDGEYQAKLDHAADLMAQWAAEDVIDLRDEDAA